MLAQRAWLPGIAAKGPPSSWDMSERMTTDFVEEQASAPSDLQSIFEEVEFLAFRRRVFEANTMYDEIMRRGKFAEAEA